MTDQDISKIEKRVSDQEDHIQKLEKASINASRIMAIIAMASAIGGALVAGLGMYTQLLKEKEDWVSVKNAHQRDEADRLVYDHQSIDQKLGELEEAVKNSSIPSGIVVAFSGGIQIEQKCPSGWSLFTPAQGKFILGASEDHSVGQTGGQEKVQLTEKELPSHSHKVGRENGDPLRTRPQQMGQGNDTVAILHLFGSNDIPAVAQAVGDNASHENMPPFVVARYCIRD